MRRILAALVLTGALGAAAGADTAASLEADGDRRLERSEYELAKTLYKLALQREPKNEILWTKYDLAHERFLRIVASARSKGPPRAPAPEPREPASPRPEDVEASPDASPAPEESPSAEETPPPTPEPAPSSSEPLYRSPNELIYLERPVRAGDTTPVGGPGENGGQIFIRTPIYEIFDVRFQVDPGGALHVSGKVKNVSAERDLRNPQVFVSLFDKNGVQIAIKPVRLLNVSAVLFRGDTGEFDASFPRFNTTVGAYRVSLDP